MDENFSPVIFLYGMAIMLAIGKAFTLWIWRDLPKPRPRIRQEVMEAWRGRRNRTRAVQKASPEPQSSPSLVEAATSDTSKAEGRPHQEASPSITNDKGAI